MMRTHNKLVLSLDHTTTTRVNRCPFSLHIIVKRAWSLQNLVLSYPRARSSNGNVWTTATSLVGWSAGSLRTLLNASEEAGVELLTLWAIYVLVSKTNITLWALIRRILNPYCIHSLSSSNSFFRLLKWQICVIVTIASMTTITKTHRWLFQRSGNLSHRVSLKVNI